MLKQPAADIKRIARVGFERAGRLVFPPTCMGCRDHVARAGTLCASCWGQMRFLERPWCPVFGTPVAQDMGDGFLSAEAIADPPPFERARAAVAYGAAARRLVQALKYRDRTDLAPWMAVWMARVGADLCSQADLLVPVPLHRRRFFVRRFNQAAELGRALSRQTGVVQAPEVLVRHRATRHQVGLGQKDRRTNVKGAFAVPKRLAPRLAGKRVVLVDDVFTTGATVRAASTALLRGGAAAVDVLTFARVVDGDFANAEDGPI